MLFSAMFAAVAAALAVASPLDERFSQGYPHKDRSQGFRLVVNVTDLSRDFSPSIQYSYITSIKVGPAHNLLGIGNVGRARLFYMNGTATEFLTGQATTISDGAVPPAPFGFSLRQDLAGGAMSTAHLDAGLGDKGYVLTRFPVPYAFLAPEQMAICYESVPNYENIRLHILNNLNLNIDKVVPPNCAPVRLMAECTDLNRLPSGSISSHDHVYDAECYKSVQSIEWAKYRPW